MNRLKPHLALLVCNVLWAMDYPFYNIVLPHYVHPMAMVSASLVATALFSLVPLLWQKAEKVERADIRKLIGAALLIGVLRKVFIMYGLSMTSPIDGSIIDTIVPLLVLVLSVLLGMDRFTRLKITGLVLGMAGAVAVVLAGASSNHAHSHLWGNVLIFLCACATSVYMVWFKRLIAKYRITTVLRWVYCAAAVMALPFGIGPIVHTDFAAIARHALFPTLFVLMVPTYVPNLMLNYALKTVQPTVSSIYTYLQPVLAIAISVGTGLDKLHADTVIFALVIFVGVGLVLRSYTVKPGRPIRLRRGRIDGAVNEKRASPKGRLFSYGVLSSYSAAETENLIVALTSLCRRAVASNSPTVLMASTLICLRSTVMPLAASASARSAAVTVPKSLPSSAFTDSDSGRLAMVSAKACASARILASLWARCLRFSARTFLAAAVADLA